MAIAAGDEVALYRTPLSTNDTLFSRGNVLFGVCILATGPTDNDILWENGQVSETVNGAYLDKIAPGNTVAKGQKIQFTDVLEGPPDPAYSGVVVRRYSRQNAGAGTAVEFVLIRSESGQLYEAQLSDTEYLPGQ